ncbi:GNAT family N-acetyltransferase [Nocardia sp. NRRL S-836]|uniref:GNAT family N-acetyltransferase n=1 Tax=Nocardia sp. NRRL S-836 TaxID=1519492 RepID=UPI0006AF5F80|nr:GNAT family N-acetyltransferase [Nocardia sp. NRRL S-836]
MEIVQGGPEHVDAAALIWAHGVAARDGHAEVPTLAQARPGVENALAHEPSLFLLAVRGGVPIGFLAGGPLRTDSGVAYVNYVGVHPDAWGEGVGEALLRALPGALAERGYEAAQLHVFVDNVRGVRLYERLGWRKAGAAAPHPRTGRVEQRYEFFAVTPARRSAGD